MEKPELGDVILSDHKIYNHYGIYTENNNVIHYIKDENNNFNGIIKETDLDTFLDGGNLYVCNFSEKVIGELSSIFFSSNAFNIPFVMTMKEPWKFPIENVNPAVIALNMIPGAWQVKVGAYIIGAAAKGIYKYLNNDLEVNRSAMKIYTAEETVNRARSQIGTGDYNLFSHNCEHFAIWCKTGIHESMQVKKALQIILPI